MNEVHRLSHTMIFVFEGLLNNENFICIYICYAIHFCS